MTRYVQRLVARAGGTRAAIPMAPLVTATPWRGPVAPPVSDLVEDAAAVTPAPAAPAPPALTAPAPPARGERDALRPPPVIRRLLSKASPPAPLSSSGPTPAPSGRRGSEPAVPDAFHAEHDRPAPTEPAPVRRALTPPDVEPRRVPVSETSSERVERSVAADPASTPIDAVIAHPRTKSPRPARGSATPVVVAPMLEPRLAERAPQATPRTSSAEISRPAPHAEPRVEARAHEPAAAPSPAPRLVIGRLSVEVVAPAPPVAPVRRVAPAAPAGPGPAPAAVPLSLRFGLGQV